MQSLEVLAMNSYLSKASSARLRAVMSLASTSRARRHKDNLVGDNLHIDYFTRFLHAAIPLSRPARGKFLLFL